VLSQIPAPRASSRGYLSPGAVRGFAFWTITLCVLVSVSVSIYAIWIPDQKEVLWKTLATSLVIAFGCGLFAAVNASLGAPADRA
jgi:type IV secretory pathway TrbD component